MTPKRARLASVTLLLPLQLALASTVLAAPPFEAARPGKVKTDDGPTSLTYGPILYDPSGNIAAIGATYYVYDHGSRVTFAAVEDAGFLQNQTYAYDVYGNRTGDGTVTYSVSTANNRLTSHGAAYDTRGNLTTWQPPGSTVARNYTWDSMNNLVYEEVAGGYTRHHVYTASDERLWTLTGTPGASCPANVCSDSRWSLRDLGGQVLREFNENGTWSHRDYVYRDGQLLASITPSTTLHYSLDHLGTPRIVTDQDAVKIADHAYFPFGSEATPESSADGRLRFTGHEQRDADLLGQIPGEIDYMHARYYASALGRFLSVDSAPARRGSPQTWNRYSYSGNMPTTHYDPNGLYFVVANEADRKFFAAAIAAGTANKSAREIFMTLANDPRPITLTTANIGNPKLHNDWVFADNDVYCVGGDVPTEGLIRVNPLQISKFGVPHYLNPTVSVYHELWHVFDVMYLNGFLMNKFGDVNTPLKAGIFETMGIRASYHPTDPSNALSVDAVMKLLLRSKRQALPLMNSGWTDPHDAIFSSNGWWDGLYVGGASPSRY